MKYSIIFSTLAAFSLSGLVGGLPAKRDGVSDVDILNFALTLEHLENTFYAEGLKRFSQDDFRKAGFPDWVRNRFEQIREHEATHVEFLTTALKAAGAQAVQACEYSFPDTDPKSFAKLSAMLETTGTSAYTGAAALIQNKDYLTAAASILSTEARQSAWVQSAALKQNPWSGPFETPLSANHVFTIAAPLIKKCPDSNPKLPFKPFPSLTLPADAAPGKKITLKFTPANTTKQQLYAVFLSNNKAVFVEMQGNDVVVPGEMKGTFFVIVSSSKDTADDEHTVAGPALVLLGEDSYGKVEA